MSFAEQDNPYHSPWGELSARASDDVRAEFIRKTYTHLTAAVLLFAGLCYMWLVTGVSESLFNAVGSSGRYGWLIVLGLFMVVSWVANSWALNSVSVAKQYAGLILYVVAESVIFCPLMFMANLFEQQTGQNIIGTAGLITLLMFGGLTAAVFVTRTDFSFLRTALVIGGLAALGFIVCGAIFGFGLGVVFMVAMIVLSCGYVLYYTSNVMLHYHVGQHVAAALALFASVALLFWYILQLLMRLNSRN